jgi:ferredoxin-type protein NapG
MREAMAPVASIVEKRLTPILRAMEQLPDELSGAVGGLGNGGRLPLDQLSSGPKPEEVRMNPVRILRPPGAGDDLGALCSGCGKCVSSCPAEAIKLDRLMGIADGLPYIVATIQACVVCDSLACMRLCPTGALTLVDKFDINMGTAKVSHQTCLRTKGEACRLCVDACPLGETAITLSKSTSRVLVKSQGCVGCGMCEQACPTQPRSIIVEPRKTQSEPIVA